MTVIYGNSRSGKSSLGYTGTYSGNYFLDVARGLVDYTTTEHRFGLAEDVDVGDGVVDIWDGSANDLPVAKIVDYTYSDYGDIGLLVSSDDTDTVAINIQGLDGSGAYVEQLVELKGHIPVSLATPLLRVLSMSNGNGTEFTGFIYLSTLDQVYNSGVPSDLSKIRGIIHPENQQSQMALYTVPYNGTLYITHGWVAVGKEKTAEVNVTIWTRPLGSVFRKLHTVSLQTSGSSSDHRHYEVPLALAGGTDIVYRVQAFSNDTSISAGFHAILQVDSSITLEPIEPPEPTALVDALGNSLINNNDDTMVSS